MILSFWRRRNRSSNPRRVRQVAAWAALDRNPTEFGSAGIWPDTHLTARACGR